MTDTSVPRLEVAGPTPGPWRSEDDRVTTRDGRVICDVRHAGTYINCFQPKLI